MDWSDEQRAAINANAGLYLVSAGAGSGKTAVLTERIRRLVDEGIVTLDHLLVLTFTNKAAHEMKGRVREAFLAEKESALAEKVEAAQITTFDSFALALVKKYHFALGLGSDIAIMDQPLLVVEERKILDEILLRHYEQKDPSFLSFVRHYALKNDANIVEMCLSLLDTAVLSGDKKAFLAGAVERYFSPEFLAGEFTRYYQLVHRDILAAQAAVKRYSAGTLSDKEAPLWQQLAEAPSYDALHDLCAKLPSYPRLPSGKNAPLIEVEDKAIHKAINAVYKDILNACSTFPEEAAERARILTRKEDAAIFVSLVEELDEKLSAYKREKAVYSFADIADLARTLALDPLIGKELRQRYTFLMVDEYQDTSDLQESFLEALNSGNFFAVGDVKQSIYRFRNANPDIFLRREERYRQSGIGQVIRLQDNYRSRGEIIADVNALFAHLMIPELGGVLYDQKQSLGHGNHDFDPSSGEDNHLEIYSYLPQAGVGLAENEARIIGKDIQARLAAPQQVKKKRGTLCRNIACGDFAILISRKRDFPIYAKVFSALKIPLAISASEDLSSVDVSLVFLSALRLIDVIDKDETAMRHVYASIRRSYLYGDSDEAIYQAITSSSYRECDLFQAVRAHQAELISGGAEEAVSFLFALCPFIEELPRLGNVKSNYEKLHSFLLQAQLFDRLGNGFKGFLEHFADLKKYKTALAIEAGEEAGDAVHLMTVHAAKGLQYKVVYCPDLDARVNTDDATSSFLMSARNGFLLPQAEAEGNPLSLLHALEKKDATSAAISEWIRLLYVDVTRAEEKLVLILRKDPPFTYSRFDESHLLRYKTGVDKKGKETLDASFTSPRSFRECLALSERVYRASSPEVEEPTPAKEKITRRKLALLAPLFHQVDFPAAPLPVVRASKRSLEPLNAGALAFGNRLHRLMELIDFSHPDTSFISDPREKAMIERVLALPLFRDVIQAQAYPEYAFADEVAHVHGSIDLLLVYPDKVVIVDYKSKDIDDPAYLLQLKVYRSYVERIFKKSVETVLLSLIDAREKRV